MSASSRQPHHRRFLSGAGGNPEDTESIFKTEERLLVARALLNGLVPALDLVFLVGDYFHDYPSPDFEFVVLIFNFFRELRQIAQVPRP